MGLDNVRRWCWSAWSALSGTLWAAALGTIIGWTCWAVSLHMLAKHGGDGRATWLAGGVALLLVQLLVTAGHLASSRWWRRRAHGALQQQLGAAGKHPLRQSNDSAGSVDQAASCWAWATQQAEVVAIALPLTLLIPFLDVACLVLWVKGVNQRLEAEHSRPLHVDSGATLGAEAEPDEAGMLSLCHEYLRTRLGFITAFQAGPQLLWYHGYLLLLCHAMHSSCGAQQPDLHWLLACVALDVATLVVGMPHLLGLLDWVTLAGLWRPKWALLREAFDVCLYIADIGSDIYFVVQRFTTPGNPAWICAIALTALLLQYPVSVVILLAWNWVPHKGPHRQPVGRRPSTPEAASLLWAGLVLTCCFWVVDIVAALVSLHECATAGWSRLRRYEPWRWIDSVAARLWRACSSCCGCCRGGEDSVGWWHGQQKSADGGGPTLPVITTTVACVDTAAGGVQAGSPAAQGAGSSSPAAWVMAWLRRCCLLRCATQDVQELLLVLLPKRPGPEWAENHLFARMPLEAALEAAPQLALQILVFLFVNTEHRPPGALFFLMLSASSSLLSIVKAGLYVWDAGTALNVSLLTTLKLLLQLQGSFRVPAGILAMQMHQPVEVVRGHMSIAIPAGDLSPLQQAACVLGQIEDAVGCLQPYDSIHVVQLRYDVLHEAGVRGQATPVRMSRAGVTEILHLRLRDLWLLLDSERQMACIVRPFAFLAPPTEHPPGTATPGGNLALPRSKSKGAQALGTLKRMLTNISCASSELQGDLWDGPLLGSLHRLRFQACDFAKFELEHLTALTVLEVADCAALRNFKAVGCQQLQRVKLQNLASLRVLHLSSCPQLQALRAEPGSLAALRELGMSGCGRLQELPFEELPALQRLDLRRCIGLAEHLPDTLECLGALTQLNLAGWTMHEVPPALCQLTALQDLNLGGCDRLECLPPLLGRLRALQTLDLSECIELKRLPDRIGKLFALTQLRLSGCSGLEELPASLEKLQRLQELHASRCSKLQSLPALGQLVALEVLDLSNCKRLLALPESLRQLSSLRVLALTGCHALQPLPAWLHHLKRQGTVFDVALGQHSQA